MKRLSIALAILLSLALGTRSAWARGGAGQFLSSNTCADISSPVSGYSWCYDSVTGEIYLYTGSWNHYGLLLSDLGSLTSPIRVVPQTPTDAASISINVTQSSGFFPTQLTTNTMVTLTGLTQANKRFALEFQQASSGGPYTVGFTNTIKWLNGTTYVASTVAGKKDLIGCMYDGTDLLCWVLQPF
jgi:hypothetical protein